MRGTGLEDGSLQENDLDSPTDVSPFNPNPRKTLASYPPHQTKIVTHAGVSITSAAGSL